MRGLPLLFLAVHARFLRLFFQYARGRTPARQQEFCAALLANARHSAVATVHLFATPAEIAEAYAGCLAEAEADVLARLRWIMHGPQLVLYKELFAATSVYAGDVCAVMNADIVLGEGFGAGWPQPWPAGEALALTRHELDVCLGEGNSAL